MWLALGRAVVGQACSAKPLGQPRLFSGQAGDVVALGTAGAESIAGSEGQERGPSRKLGQHPSWDLTGDLS